MFLFASARGGVEEAMPQPSGYVYADGRVETCERYPSHQSTLRRFGQS